MPATDVLIAQAWDAEQAGRHDEAVALMTRAARDGSIDAARTLGDWLTDDGGDRRAEGRGWLETAAEAGDETAAWNLAMECRLDDDRDGYLTWMRRAAELGSDEAPAILKAIDNLRAEGRPWAMYFNLCVDRDDVWGMLQDFLDDEITAEGLRKWALAVHLRQTTLRLAEAGAAALARILAELAGVTGRDIDKRRASELIFKLQNEIPDPV